MLCSAAGDETLRFWRVGSDSHHYEDSPKKGLMASKKRLNLRWFQWWNTNFDNNNTL